jgi:hypothetical protein
VNFILKSQSAHEQLKSLIEQNTTYPVINAVVEINNNIAWYQRSRKVAIGHHATMLNV